MKTALGAFLIATLAASALLVSRPSTAMAVVPVTEFAFEIPPGSLFGEMGSTGYTRVLGWSAPDASTPNRDEVSFFGTSPFGDVRFEGPNGTAVTAGTTYLDARTIDHAASDKAVFDMRDLFECDDVRTDFTVDDIARDGTGRLTRLALSWEFRCAGAAKAARGEVRIDQAAAPLKAFVQSPTHLTVPAWASTTDALVVGHTGAPVEVTLTGAGMADVSLGTIAMGGDHPDDWQLADDACSGETLAADETCTFTIAFKPVDRGWRDAEIVIPSDATTGTRRIDVRAPAKSPTTTTIQLASNPAFSPEQPSAIVTIVPDPGSGQACVHIHGAQSGEYTCKTMGAGGVTTIPFSPSDHSSVSGYFPGTELFAGSEGSSVTQVLGMSSVVVIGSSLNPQQVTKPVTVTASVQMYQNSLPLTSGTLTITDTTTSQVLGSVDVATATTLTVSGPMSLGSHALVAEYTGQAGPPLVAASSANLTQQIVADQKVDLASTGIAYATFYPVVDSFKDSVAVRGTLGEPATLSIKVVALATGKTVRSLTVGAKPVGPYTWSWNGRNKSGTLQAAGKYAITQTVTDGSGNKVSATSKVNLSKRRVTWKTVTLTKTAAKFVAQGATRGADINTPGSGYPGGVYMSAAAGGEDLAAVVYSFILPSAPGYRSVTFRVIGRTLHGEKAWIGVWAPSRGSYLDIGTYDTLKRAGTAYGTYSTSASGPTHTASARARGLLMVAGTVATSSEFDAAKVKMTVVYARWAN